MSVYVIIAAGGQGTRIGGPIPKQWLRIGERSILAHSVAACAAVPAVDGLVVVVAEDRIAAAEADVAASAAGKPWTVLVGGARRQDSVANGAAALPADAAIVLVHDAARPFVSTAVVTAVIDAARAVGAAIAAVPVHDTVKRAERDGEYEWCAETLPRERIHLAQTPQGFQRHIFDAVVALGRDASDATDEATLAERAGYRVQVVPGDPANVKITTRRDLDDALRRMAQAEGGQRVAGVRVGVGYDSHRFDASRGLTLGGVDVPGVPGLAGHSDGDAVCHAVTDAVLGAAGLGDIGGLFPDTDPTWKDADSLDLLRRAWQRVEGAGYRLGNLDIAVICERPKIGPLGPALRGSLASVLGCTQGAISIKGKTPEGTPGLADALVVHAVALIERV